SVARQGKVRSWRCRLRRSRQAGDAEDDVVDCRKAQQAKAVAGRRGARGMARTGTAQGPGASESGIPVPGDQATVWLREGPLQGTGEEPRPGADAVRAVKPVDGATKT